MTETLDGVFRREAGRCTATLIRVLGDLDLAEDAVAEAFAVAAEQWPKRGIPPNPGGWITTTARNRAIDRLRRDSTRVDRYIAAHQMHTQDTHPDATPERDALDRFVDVVPDDQLRLMFLCCHPALAADSQVALTLRLLGGLETGEIATAFLLPEATIAQRIVRAKRKLRDNHAPYRIPGAAELPDRLRAVLASIYLIYTEGHTATTGPALTRVDLSTEAIRIGRVLATLMPDEPEVIGLLALMLLAEARRASRVDAHGSMVRLADQDRSRWDANLIEEGHRLVQACLRRNQPGPFPDPIRNRRRSHRRAHGRRHRLASDRRAVRPALRDPAQPDRRVESGRRGGRARWPLSWAQRARQCQPRRLPAIPRGPSRPARSSRTDRRSDRGLRPRHRTHDQRRRTRVPQPATPTCHNHRVAFLASTRTVAVAIVNGAGPPWPSSTSYPAARLLPLPAVRAPARQHAAACGSRPLTAKLTHDERSRQPYEQHAQRPCQ
jgi:RNA polymerase sigma factor (sigma-70 family)